MDDLMKLWAAHEQLLAQSVAVNQRVLREVLLPRTVPRWWIVEILVGLIVLASSVRVLVAHGSEVRYLVLGGAACVVAAAATASAAWLLVRTLQIDPARPVAVLQRAVLRLRLVEYHATLWVLLGGIVVWLPSLLLLGEAVTGVPLLARVDGAWLAANVALGVGVLMIGRALSLRYVERSVGPRARAVMDALTGRTLRRLAARVDEIAAFER